MTYNTIDIQQCISLTSDPPHIAWAHGSLSIDSIISFIQNNSEKGVEKGCSSVILNV